MIGGAISHSSSVRKPLLLRKKITIIFVIQYLLKETIFPLDVREPVKFCRQSP